MSYYEKFSDADEKTRERLNKILFDDEEVVCVVRNQDFLTRILGIDPTEDNLFASLGDLGDSFWRLALTDQRLIKFSPVQARGTDAYQLGSINNINYGSVLEISGSGYEEEFDEFYPGDVKLLVEDLREQVAEA